MYFKILTISIALDLSFLPSDKVGCLHIWECVCMWICVVGQHVCVCEYVLGVQGVCVWMCIVGTVYDCVRVWMCIGVLVRYVYVYCGDSLWVCVCEYEFVCFRGQGVCMYVFVNVCCEDSIWVCVCVCEGVWCVVGGQGVWSEVVSLPFRVAPQQKETAWLSHPLVPVLFSVISLK